MIRDHSTADKNEYGIPETAHQKPVRKLLVKGLSNKDISAKLKISLATTKYHVGNILKSWKVKSRTRLVAKVKGLS